MGRPGSERQRHRREDFELLSRRQLFRGAGGTAGLLALGAPGLLGPQAAVARPPTGGGSLSPGDVLPSTAVRATGKARRFRSAPHLWPPTATVRRAVGAGAVSSGSVFMGPQAGSHSQSGALIVDQVGEPVWFRPVPSGHWVTNFQAGSYRHAPAAFWWEGEVIPPGFGVGEGVVVDAAYRQMARVRAANGRSIDLHEFQLTPQGTALFTCYPPIVHADLRSAGGSSDGHVYESVIQEVDVATGRLLLEWRSLEHIPVSESYLPVGDPFDYLHVNSIDVLPDGNLLISARNTWAVYKLDRHTGQVIWRLGGKRSDFAMGPHTRFAWQHDARQPVGDAITIFDDGSDGYSSAESQSRAIVLDVDTRRRRANLSHAYRHPHPLLAFAMGSVQSLPGGHVLVGWGNDPVISEFGADATWLSDLRVPSPCQSYRGYRFRWTARPKGRPALAARRNRGSRATTLYASWNGATDVAWWRVHAGTRATHLRAIGIAARKGFETVIRLPAPAAYAAVTALDPSGHALATSRTITV